MQELDNDAIKRAVERFTRYVRVATTSSMHSDTSPSTREQLELSRMLKSELESLGASRVIENKGNLVATVSASVDHLKNVPPLVLCAHIDTTPDFSGENVVPMHIHNYDGKTIALQNKVVLDPKEIPELLRYTDTDIITGDGRTLLGADDKAGLAGICTVLELLRDGAIAHGPLEIVFTTDEEIGQGLRDVPLDRLKGRCGITADGQELGSYEYENFNAVTGTFRIEGSAVHPGSAKNKMVNAIQICNKVVTLFAENEFPESCDGRDGFVCPLQIEGNLAVVTLTVIVRDFSADGIQHRLQKLEKIAQALTATCDGAQVSFSGEWAYKNMYDTVKAHPILIETIEEAIQAAGVTPYTQVIRGGTDGALFADHGIAMVNLFTGAHNLHGPREWLAVAAFEKSILSMMHFVSLWAKKHSAL